MLVCLVMLLALVLSGAAAAASAQTVSGRIVSAATQTGVAHVRACAESSTWGGACAESAANGDYSVKVPESGRYVLEFFAAPGSELMWRTYYPGVFSYAQAKEVDVPSGEVSGVDIELQVGGQVSGVVTGAPSATPLAGITVCAREPETLVIVGMEGNWGCSLTDLTGEYVVPGLPTGNYEVKFDVPSSSGLNYFTQFYDDHEDEWEANLVKVTAGETKGAIDDELPEGGQIDGVVTSTETGHPIAGGEVCANWTGGGSEFRCAKTNAKGEYALLRLRTGKFWVQFSAPGYVSEYYGGFSRFTEAAVVSVTSGKATSGTDFALKEPGRVSGTVTDALTHGGVSRR